MTGPDPYRDSGGDVGVSGFGGHPLTSLSTDGADDETGYLTAADGVDTGLSSLGMLDVEQLLGAAAVPGVSEELQGALGMGSDDLQSLLDTVRSALPAERAALMSQPAPADLGLGALPPTDDMIAAIQATAAYPPPVAAATLPTTVNLIPDMSAIRNQGPRGTCVAFTLTALHEYVLRRRGTARQLSPQHLYRETKAIDGAADACGTWQSRAVTVLRDRGQCREVVWPYNPNPPCNNHGVRPTAARPDALNYRLVTFPVAPRDVAAYKTELARERPVTLSIPVYNSWYQSAETRRSGRITMRVGGEIASGGHAVCLAGYQDSATSPGGGYFVVRNSWGSTWAAQSPYGAGYGTIPYAYIEKDAYEAFSVAMPSGVDVDEGASTGGSGITGTASVTIEVGPLVKVIIETR